MLVTQLCSTLWDPVDCSPPGSSFHGILQGRMLEWVAIPFSRYLPNSGIKYGLPAFQVDSLPSEPPGIPGAKYLARHCFQEACKPSNNSNFNNNHHASHCTVPLYFSRYYTVSLKMFSLFFMFILYVLFVWKVFQTYYSTVLYDWLCLLGT